jgi:hypothetical protein
MEGIEKPHTGKYKEITNNWNCDASCSLTSLPVWDLENFKHLIFVVQSVLTLRIRVWITLFQFCYIRCSVLILISFVGLALHYIQNRNSY